MASKKLTDSEIETILKKMAGVRLGNILPPVFGGFGALRHAQYQVQVYPTQHSAQKIHLSDDDRVMIARAFQKVRNGYEPDRVLIDQKLSRAYLAECHRLGVRAPAAVLNRALQGLRKAKAYGIDIGESKKSSGIDADQFLSVAELAYAQLNRSRRASVDLIITNPRIGDQYLAICKSIDPSGSAMEFKWAVLSLRKGRSLNKERLERISTIDVGAVESQLRIIDSITKVKAANLPDDRGVFAFTEIDAPKPYLYVGASHNLSLSMRPFESAKAFIALSHDTSLMPRLDRVKLMFAPSTSKRYLIGRATPLMASLSIIHARQPVYNMQLAAN